MLDREYIEKEYVPFIINKSLSYFVDCILFVTELDRRSDIPKWDQYLFYYHSVPKKKRFCPWHKVDRDKHLDAVKEFYNFSAAKANTVIKLLTDAQLQEIARLTDKGGKK